MKTYYPDFKNTHIVKLFKFKELSKINLEFYNFKNPKDI
jgi:hypothetical protein